MPTHRTYIHRVRTALHQNELNFTGGFPSPGVTGDSPLIFRTLAPLPVQLYVEVQPTTRLLLAHATVLRLHPVGVLPMAPDFDGGVPITELVGVSVFVYVSHPPLRTEWRRGQLDNLREGAILEIAGV